MIFWAWLLTALSSLQINTSPAPVDSPVDGTGAGAAAVAPAVDRPGRSTQEPYVSLGVYHAGVAVVKMPIEYYHGVDKVRAEVQRLAQLFRSTSGADGPSEAVKPKTSELAVKDGKLPVCTVLSKETLGSDPQFGNRV